MAESSVGLRHFVAVNSIAPWPRQSLALQSLIAHFHAADISRWRRAAALIYGQPPNPKRSSVGRCARRDAAKYQPRLCELSRVSRTRHEPSRARSAPDASPGGAPCNRLRTRKPHCKLLRDQIQSRTCITCVSYHLGSANTGKSFNTCQLHNRSIGSSV